MPFGRTCRRLRVLEAAPSPRTSLSPPSLTPCFLFAPPMFSTTQDGTRRPPRRRAFQRPLKRPSPSCGPRRAFCDRSSRARRRSFRGHPWHRRALPRHLHVPARLASLGPVAADPAARHARRRRRRRWPACCPRTRAGRGSCPSLAVDTSVRKVARTRKEARKPYILLEHRAPALELLVGEPGALAEVGARLGALDGRGAVEDGRIGQVRLLEELGDGGRDWVRERVARCGRGRWGLGLLSEARRVGT